MAEQILKRYRASPEDFTIVYRRHKPQHCLPVEVDNLIRHAINGPFMRRKNGH